MSETYVTQDEFKRLEARVSSAEQEADGEKMLSRYILTQARQNGDDLAILKTRIDRIEGKIDQLEQRVGHVETDLGSLTKRSADDRSQRDARSAARDAEPLERDPQKHVLVKTGMDAGFAKSSCQNKCIEPFRCYRNRKGLAPAAPIKDA